MGVLFRPSRYSPPRFSCSGASSSRLQLYQSPRSNPQCWEFRPFGDAKKDQDDNSGVIRFPLPFENLAQMIRYQNEDVPWIWDQPIHKPDRFQFFHHGYGQVMDQ